MKRELKVAIVQDWFTVNGGAEKVVRELFQLFPNAVPFSLIDYLNDEDRAFILNGKRSNTSIIQKFPFSKRFYRMYLPWMPYAIEQLDLRNFDIVISSSYAVSKGVLTHKDQVHICYCHSPMRYIWDLYLDYIPKIKWYNFPYAIMMRRIISKIRIWDVVSSNRVDHFVANSNNVADRITKTYRRTSEVIYPPVDLSGFKVKTKKEDYYVTAARLVPYKRIDLIIKAFRELPNEKLVVCGSGPELRKLKNLSRNHANIEVVGHISREDYISKISGAKAFIHASLEDFGLAPVEAQACGTPVIGFGKGGTLESTKEGETAVHFHKQTVDEIKAAVQRFDPNKLSDPEGIGTFARQFSKETFRKAFMAHVERCIS